MIFLPALAALLASTGWATGSVLAHDPARRLGAFEFTRIQLIACSAILAAICSGFGLWSGLNAQDWPLFVISSVLGILLGNLAMIEALRRGGPRLLELLLTFKAPFVALLAFLWLGELPSIGDAIGAGVTLIGVVMAIVAQEDGPQKAPSGLGTVITLGLLAAGLQGIGFLSVKPALQAGAEPLAVSALRLLGAGALISLIALWPAKTFRPKEALTPRLLGATIVPGFIGYGVSSSLLLYAMAHLEAGIAVTLGALSPVLVLPILWLKTGVRPRPLAVIGAGIAVLGTALIALL